MNRLCNIGITCSKIEHIPYNLVFTTKFNDFSILIMIISWDYLNLSLANEYVGDITIPIQVIKNNQCCSRRISESDCSIHIKLNHSALVQLKKIFFFRKKEKFTIQFMLFWYVCKCLLFWYVCKCLLSVSFDNLFFVF